MNMRIPATIALFLAVLLATRAAAQTPVPQTPAKASNAVAVARPKVEDVWLVFKTHFDIGYTDTVEGVLSKYRVQMMDGALGIIDQERRLPPEKRFAWTVSGWPLAHILGPRRSRLARPASSRRSGKERSRSNPCRSACTRRLSIWKTWCGDCDSRRRSPASTAGRCPSRRR